jgi:hypothetical protein
MRVPYFTTYAIANRATVYNLLSFQKTNICTYLVTNIDSYLKTNIDSYLETNIDSYLVTNIDSYLETNIDSYLVTNIDSYLKTNIDSYFVTNINSYLKTNSEDDVNRAMGYLHSAVSRPDRCPSYHPDVHHSFLPSASPVSQHNTALP